MAHRFLVPGLRSVGDVVPLPSEEAAHASRVLRLQPGDAVGLFDGRGVEYRGVVVAVGRDVLVRPDTVWAATPEASVRVTLVQAVLKGDKMDGVVRDAVMIGVASIRPIVTARSETSVAALARGDRGNRWRRVAVASAKQCGRAVIPDVDDPVALPPGPEWLDRLDAPAPRLLLVEPGAGMDAAPPVRVPRPEDARASIVVGPEGGWSPEELTALSATCVPLRLGARTLRADTAGLIAVASLFAVWDAL